MPVSPPFVSVAGRRPAPFRFVPFVVSPFSVPFGSWAFAPGLFGSYPKPPPLLPFVPPAPTRVPFVRLCVLVTGCWMKRGGRGSRARRRAMMIWRAG